MNAFHVILIVVAVLVVLALDVIALVVLARRQNPALTPVSTVLWVLLVIVVPVIGAAALTDQAFRHKSSIEA